MTYLVPATVEDMLPAKAATLYNEAQSLLRHHWDEARPYFEALAGGGPSIHGASDLDEAACVFAMQKLAAANGYTALASVSAATLRRALRVGYKRNSGHAVRKLVQQRKQLTRQAAE